MLYHDRGLPELYALAERLINAHNLEHLCGIWGLLKIDNLEMTIAKALRGYDDWNTLLDPETSDGARTLRVGLWADTNVDASGRAYRSVFELRDVRDGKLMIDVLPGPRHRTGICFGLPLSPVLAHCEDFTTGSYVVYLHEFPETEGQRYCGITRQGWLPRWKQHMSAARNGSRYLFHKAILKNHDRLQQYHEIVGVNLGYEDAMNLEEALVAKHSLYPMGLNMIPGGFAGMQWLGKQGYKPSPRDWEHRQKFLKHFASHCGRKGVPNPLASARWHDADFSRRVICNNPQNFDYKDVGEIRYLASLGWDHDFIAERFACRTDRVRQLIAGRTYSRVV